MPEDKKTLSRRHLLTSSLASASAVLLAGRAAHASRCVATPAQVEGPFYPVRHRLEEDNDLTWRHDREQPARGEVMDLLGQVTEGDCTPVPRALVEIWQACASGKYDHPNDDNPAPLDPNFQYWGRTVTDYDGNYRFRTVRPGAYPNDPTWMRPSHIHVRVHRRGFFELTTQMYFAGDRYNAADKLLQRLPSEQQARLVIAPDTRGAVPTYRFDLSLLRV